MDRISRLSVSRITDPIAYGRFIRDVQAGNDGWRKFSITEDYRYRHDKLAVDVYGTEECIPVVMAAAGCSDLTDPLPVGTELALPDTAWLRRRIKELEEGKP